MVAHCTLQIDVLTRYPIGAILPPYLILQIFRLDFDVAGASDAQERVLVRGAEVHLAFASADWAHHFPLLDGPAGERVAAMLFTLTDAV